jgi:thiol-disulfide isomerase/thioredoxin
VVNIWASWCGPCTVEAPELAKVSKEFAGKVQFLGVDIQDQIGPARAFITKYGWTYPSVFDPSGSIRDQSGYLGVPVTVVFDATGKQVFVYPGAVNARLLRKQLAGLV